MYPLKYLRQNIPELSNLPATVSVTTSAVSVSEVKCTNNLNIPSRARLRMSMFRVKIHVDVVEIITLVLRAKITPRCDIDVGRHDIRSSFHRLAYHWRDPSTCTPVGGRQLRERKTAECFPPCLP